MTVFKRFHFGPCQVFCQPQDKDILAVFSCFLAVCQFSLTGQGGAIIFLLIFLGPPQLRCGATFRGSQVCSALRPDGLGLRLRRPPTHR